MRKQFEDKVAQMKVAEIRKEAGKYGIKNASKYKRAELSAMLVDAMMEKYQEYQEQHKQESNVKRIKAKEINNDQVETLAREILEGIETLGEEDLMQVNRKVLIRVMKALHCSKWYRTYDKATMVAKITGKVA